MKNRKHFIKILLGLIFSIGFLTHIKAQDQVYNGDLRLSSQTQINNFNYKQVTGFLIIWEIESGNIVDLTTLHTLESVGGDLQIRQNAALTDLDGLESLTSVGGYLSVGGNIELTNLDGLESLISVGGYINIAYNTELTNLDGLQSLTSVSGNLNITSNPALINLDGLKNVTSVGGDIFIYENPALTNVDGLQSLTSVSEHLYIYYNDILSNLDGLQSLTSVGGILSIGPNLVLTNVDGLQNLKSVTRSLRISSNTALTDLDGLKNLTSIGEQLFLNDNSVLTNLDGLRSLTSVSGNVTISDNTVLVSFCGLYPLLNSGTIDGTVQIWNNGANPTVTQIKEGGPCTIEDHILTLEKRVEQLVNEGVLNEGQGNAFITKLDLSLLQIDKGKYRFALNILRAFINQVNSYVTEGLLTEKEGQELISAANDIINMINDENNLPKSTNDNITEEIQSEQPEYYSLAQNYPNPFNPTTTIVYGLPEDASVVLKIYNVLGAEVMRFEEGGKTAGYHKVSFDASGLPSGIYIYRLQAGTFVDTKKMLFLK